MKTNAYLRLMRFDKPVGSLLLLYPTLIALFVATDGSPSLLSLIVFVLGVFITRAAGCVLNDIADRKIDGSVQRTALRPIAAGEITVTKALITFFILAVLGLGLLIGFCPPATYIWAILCVGLMAIYPLSKRWFKIPQLFLGLAFSMPVFMVYAFFGVNPLSSITAIALFVANAAWTVAYDTNYALADMDDDLKLGTVNSSAIFFGKKVNLVVLCLNLIYLGIFALLGVSYNYGVIFYTCLVLNLAIFVYQFFNVNRLVGETGFRAFMQNITVGAITTVGVVFGLLNMQLTAINKLKVEKQQLETKIYQLENPTIPAVEPTSEPTPVPADNPSDNPTPTPEPTPAPVPADNPSDNPAPAPEPTPSPVPADNPSDNPAPTPEPTPSPVPVDNPSDNTIDTPTPTTLNTENTPQN